MSLARSLPCVLLLVAACGRGGTPPAAPVPASVPPIDPNDALTSAEPLAPAAAAYRSGWMPLASTGVDAFLRAHPEADGRGVLIAILDGGVDAGVAGLTTTSTGDPKLLDLRDFSGEGRVALAPLEVRGDAATIAGREMVGLRRVAAFSRGPFYGGILTELPLGEPPASDLNGNGTSTDTLPIVVARATDGWALFADTDGDGSLADEHPVRDYLVARETFGWSAGDRPAPVTVAVNFSPAEGPPVVDLFFDTGGHGTHVAGIAAGNDLYGVAGFDGVAPGARLLGLKIANDAHGGVTVTGSMLAAMDYAIRFARARSVPLVLNLSFGVGNEAEGAARIDALVDSVLAAHPDVVMVVSAGNDGPGLSTVGFPGSAARAIGVGATFPTVFVGGGRLALDPVATFSARGGELAKPDVVAPGIAYSSVPRWNVGDERKLGTSMAAPHVSGVVALLLSALRAEGRLPSALEVRQALMVTAQPSPGATFVDEGTGLVDVGRAHRWLLGRHAVTYVDARTAGGAPAAFHLLADAPPREMEQRFVLRAAPGVAPVAYRLRSDARWLVAPDSVTVGAGEASVILRYRLPRDVRGLSSGVVAGWGPDTLAGPAFRLVNTVVVPHPFAETTRLAPRALPAGGVMRTFFVADSGRPFTVEVEAGRGQVALAHVHEPGGMPFREQAERPAGSGSEAAVFHVDGRDAVAGVYEVVVAAQPQQSSSAAVTVRQSPMRLDVRRKTVSGGLVTLTNLTRERLTGNLGVLLVGAERRMAVWGRGSGAVRTPIVVPPWATGIVVDAELDRAAWPRFTDLGFVVADSAGRQLAQSPLNYALGRLDVPLPPREGDLPATVDLYPGFADSSAAGEWGARLSARFYADSAVVLSGHGAGPALFTAEPGMATSIELPVWAPPWPLRDDMVPIGVVVLDVAGETWTWEVELPSPPLREKR